MDPIHKRFEYGTLHNSPNVPISACMTYLDDEKNNGILGIVDTGICSLQNSSLGSHTIGSSGRGRTRRRGGGCCHN
jgi:hypothetical protein